MPKISVIMPVFNVSAYIRQAMNSVLCQSFQDFEVIVVDDGSTDDTPLILSNFARSDSRVRVFSQRNSGIVAALNRAVSEARGEFLARMDGDDVCLPKRFERQVQFLSDRPGVDICGCWYETFSAERSQRSVLPQTHEEIVCELLYSNPICHPSVFLRRLALEASGLRYRDTHLYAEDYDLWVRAAHQLKFANLPEVLFRLRSHAERTTNTKAAVMAASTTAIQSRILQNVFNRPLTEEELTLHQQLSTGAQLDTLDGITQVQKWAADLVAANECSASLPPQSFQIVTCKRWARFCFQNGRKGVRVWSAYRAGPRPVASPSTAEYRLWLKCVLKGNPVMRVKACFRRGE